MSTRITTLVENHKGEHLTLHEEHGVSFLIEHNGTTVLFDTGQSDAFLKNAAIMRKDLRSISEVVLSHGHYDHTNGLPYLVEAGFSQFTLNVHERFFDEKLATDGLSTTYLGPSWDQEWCETHGIALRTIRGEGTQIAPGIHVITGFLRNRELEVNNPRFIVNRPGASAPEIDDFRDEVSLVIESGEGLIVLVGCSHPGIMNILDTVNERFEAPIHTVLGGTHLVEAEGTRLQDALQNLQGATIHRLGLSHCTGDIAMDLLERQSSVFFRNVTGTTIDV